MKFEDFAAKKMLEIAHEGDQLTDREKQLIGLAPRRFEWVRV